MGKRRRRKFTGEFKKEAVRLFREGERSIGQGLPSKRFRRMADSKQSVAPSDTKSPVDQKLPQQSPYRSSLSHEASALEFRAAASPSWDLSGRVARSAVPPSLAADTDREVG